MLVLFGGVIKIKSGRGYKVIQPVIQPVVQGVTLRVWRHSEFLSQCTVPGDRGLSVDDPVTNFYIVLSEPALIHFQRIHGWFGRWVRSTGKRLHIDYLVNHKVF